MKTSKLTRRDFLRLSAMGAGGLALAACAAPPPPAPAAAPAAAAAVPPTAAPAPTAVPAATAAPPAAAEMVLTVVSDTPEYASQHQQIADQYTELHPNVKIDWVTHSEDGQAAYVAKTAAGYVPEMETCLGQRQHDGAE